MTPARDGDAIVAPSQRLDRRRLVGAGAALVGGAALVPAVRAAAQEDGARGYGDVPTTGARRPGPIGPVAPLVARRDGQLPIAVRIPKIGVEADVEYLAIIDGVMQNPNGPFLVGWYEETAKPGATGNAVMAGHVDYYTVGPAIFYDVKLLTQGDQIEVIGEDGTSAFFAVDWLQNFPAQPTPEEIQDIVGPTEDENLTLITCIGTFDAGSGEYDQRLIVRASMIES